MAQKHDITVLIVEGDDALRELWARVIVPIADVKCASTVREAIGMVPTVDVLVVSWNLGLQTAETVLDEWMNLKGGPVCVLSDDLDKVEIDGLFSLGVYNAFVKPVSPSVVSSVVRHYVQDVRAIREIANLSKQLKRLQGSMIVLGLMLAASGGPALIPVIQGLF
jgi:response regulator of citrate/malate metabolism